MTRLLLWIAGILMVGGFVADMYAMQLKGLMEPRGYDYWEDIAPLRDLILSYANIAMGAGFLVGCLAAGLIMTRMK